MDRLCTHDLGLSIVDIFVHFGAPYYLAILCVLRELRKSLVIPDRIEVMNSGFFNALRIVSRDTALDRGPPSPPQSSSKIDYQKSNFNNRLSKIDYQKSIIRSIVKDRSRVNRKSTAKNRLLEIDLQKSILFWMHTPINSV